MTKNKKIIKLEKAGHVWWRDIENDQLLTPLQMKLEKLLKKMRGINEKH